MSKAATKAKPSTGGALTVPKGFKTGQIMPRKKVSSGGSGDAFIWVAHKQSGLWDEISGKIKSLANGQFVYVAAGNVERLQPMKYHLLEAFHFFAELDDVGEITTAYDEDAESKPKDAKEFVEALIAVYLKSTVAIARVTFKGATIGAVAPMLAEFNAMAEDPDAWAKQSKEHATAAKLMGDDLSAFRYFGLATTTPKQTKDGKFTYSLGNCQASPSTSTELAVLKDSDLSAIESIRKAFVDRIADVKSKME